MCKSNCMNQYIYGFGPLDAQTVEDKCGYPELNVQCGKSLAVGSAIVRGEVAKRGAWPFLVALKYRESLKFFCGGNLISSRHVLTGEL